MSRRPSATGPKSPHNRQTLSFQEFSIMIHKILLCFYFSFFSPLVSATQKSAKNSDNTANADSGKKSAEAVINRVYESAKRITSSKASDQNKAKQLTDLILSLWDINKIAEHIMYPYWKTFTDAEKSQFKGLLTQNVVRTFQRVAKKYLGRLTVVKVSPIQRKQNAYDVHCKVVNAEDGRTVDVRFQVVGKKIRNLFVEKLDLVDAKRTEYASLMRQNRKSSKAFLEALERSSSKGTHKDGAPLKSA